MPLPKLPTDWRWAQFESIGDDLHNAMREILVTWIAFPGSGRGEIVGTGFIIGGAPSGHAIAITAKHVIAEGVVAVQAPNPRHAPSALPEFLPPALPRVAPEAVRAVWMGPNTADMMLVEHVFYSASLDIAVTFIRPQDHVDAIRLQPLPIDTSLPVVGEQVVLYSCAGLEMQGGEIKKGDTGAIARSVIARTGHVTEVFPAGYRQYRWPCFTTTIPAEPGMSGGFVCRSRKDDRIAACGVVSADWSTEEARKNFSEAGESLIGAIWPSLGLAIPWLCNEELQTRRLIDAVREGAIVDIGDGVDRFVVVAKEGDDVVVHRR